MDKKKGKLLIVDDEPNIRLLVRKIFEKEYNVIEAENGKEAVDSALRNEPDIILMDIMMPEMDGYETIRVIRKDVRFKSTPIIALTAKAMKGDREKCIAAGASDYISKPINTDQLLSLMRVWLYK